MSSMAPPLDERPRSTRLRALIDDLILFGRLLIETLQKEPASEAATRIITRFGGRGIAAIIARITRGLMLAMALDDRVIRLAKRIDNPPPPRLDDRLKRPARKRPAQSPVAYDDAALLARMPTAEEIAANIRNRPLGTVLADIAHDLGLAEADPLWRRIHTEIYRSFCVISMFRLMRPILEAQFPRRRRKQTPAASPVPRLNIATGPPLLVAA